MDYSAKYDYEIFAIILCEWNIQYTIDFRTRLWACCVGSLLSFTMVCGEGGGVAARKGSEQGAPQHLGLHAAQSGCLWWTCERDKSAVGSRSRDQLQVWLYSIRKIPRFIHYFSLDGPSELSHMAFP